MSEEKGEEAAALEGDDTSQGGTKHEIPEETTGVATTTEGEVERNSVDEMVEGTDTAEERTNDTEREVKPTALIVACPSCNRNFSMKIEHLPNMRWVTCPHCNVPSSLSARIAVSPAHPSILSGPSKETVTRFALSQRIPLAIPYREFPTSALERCSAGLEENPYTHRDCCLPADSGPDEADYCTKSLVGMVLLLLAGLLIFDLVKESYYSALLLLAIAPACVLIHCCYTMKDRSSVRLNTVVRQFLFGIMGAIPVVLVEGVLLVGYHFASGTDSDQTLDPDSHVVNSNDDDPVWLTVYVSAFVMSFIVASTCEESLKYLLLWRLYDRPAFRTPQGAVVLGLAGALGFATIENIFYVFEGGWLVALIRATVSVPMHGITGAIMGAILARFKFLPAHDYAFHPLPRWAFLKTATIPILLHGSFNFPLFVTSFLGQPLHKGGWIPLLACPFLDLLGFLLYRYLMCPFHSHSSDAHLLVKGNVGSASSLSLKGNSQTSYNYNALV